MKKSIHILSIIFLLGLSGTLYAQKTEAPNVVLITLDGLRWQELFSGSDPLLVANKE